MKISMLCTHLFCFQLLFLSLFIHYCYAKKRVLGETNELESFGETEKQTTPRVKSITDYLLPPTPRIYPGNIMPPAMPRKGNEFLSASIKSSYILDNYYIYNQDTRTRNFQGSVMLYVTPWNKKGYEMAKIMAPKLDYLAPVWFIAKKEGKKVVVHGENDVDKDWLQAVRNAHKSSPITEDKEIHTESVDKNTCTEDTCSSTSSTADLTSSPASTPDVDSSSVPPTIKSTVIPPPSISSSSSSSPLTSTAGDNKMPKNNPLRIVPRVSLEAAFELSELPSLVSLLLSLQKKYSFDGFTLELSLNYWDISKTLPKMLKEEAAKLKSSSTSSSSSSTTSCHIVFVIPPISVPEDRTEFNKAMAQLSSHVDVFSVMTYDKNKGQAMPNSPLDWVNSTMTGLASVSQPFPSCRMIPYIRKLKKYINAYTYNFIYLIKSYSSSYTPIPFPPPQPAFTTVYPNIHIRYLP